MSNRLRLVARLCGFVCIVWFLASVAAPVAPGIGPYVTALSDAAITPIRAQGECTFTKCRYVPNTHCHNSLIASNCYLGQGSTGCQSEPC